MGGRLEIKIFGSHCRRCRVFEENVRRAVSELGLNAGVECLTDLDSFFEYGIFHLPALAINGKVIVQGTTIGPKRLQLLLVKWNEPDGAAPRRNAGRPGVPGDSRP